MTTTISVSKLPVNIFLQTAKVNPFVIPLYQRPYAWEEDQVQTLFDDLKNFSSSIEENTNNPSQYFLGCIVTFLNPNGKQEIIDGQQRITSLYLLLRAIYTKLKSDPSSPRKLIWEIEKCLWQTDNSTDDEIDYSNILLSSCIINNAGNEILKNILTTGQSDPKANDNYSKNYRLFQKYLDNFSLDSTANFRSFVKHILENAIVLPISADSQETALTIFSTLNDRGMPLSDADIFKANIYSNKDINKRAKFIQDWQELNDKATYVSEKIQHLFYYYMFYLRASDGISKTTMPGLRTYYTENTEKLLSDELMDNLAIITNLWQVVNRHEPIPSESWSYDTSICQSLDILNSYPNEFWKYPVIIYYLTHRKKENFKDSFALFLNKLILELTTKYVISPTINAVKTSILKLNVAIIKSQYPSFDFIGLTNESIQSFRDNSILPHRNILRMLLKILTYQKQDTLLPDNWEIEHIFPLKSNSKYIRISNPELIEHVGNKLPFEKRLNIVASNQYFKDKQDLYRQSNIRITQELSYSADIIQWDDDCILQRDREVIDTILDIFKKWDAQYTNKLQEGTSNN